MSRLEAVIDELESKAAYLNSLYKSAANARKGNYDIQIARLKQQIGELQCRIEVLEEKKAEFGDTATIIARAKRTISEIRILNVIAEMLGSPVAESCKLLRGGEYRMYRGHLKGKNKGTKSITPTKRPIRLGELLAWCRANMDALENGDEDRLSILVDEYTEK